MQQARNPDSYTGSYRESHMLQTSMDIDGGIPSTTGTASLPVCGSSARNVQDCLDLRLILHAPAVAPSSVLLKTSQWPFCVNAVEPHVLFCFENVNAQCVLYQLSSA